MVMSDFGDGIDAGLDRLLTIPPGSGIDERGGRWGLPADETCVATAKAVLSRVSPMITPWYCYVDICDGSVCVSWSVGMREIVVYFGPGYVETMIGYHVHAPNWDINIDYVSRDDAVRVLSQWMEARNHDQGMV